MGQSDHLDSSLNFGAGTWKSPDSEATPARLIPAGLPVLPRAEIRASKDHAARKNPSAAVGGVKV